MSIAIITGSGGLIGSEASRYFAAKGLDVIGIDNDMRAYFFGEDSSTRWNSNGLKEELGDRYTHCSLDIRDDTAIDNLFAKYGTEIKLIVHTAAQPIARLGSQGTEDRFFSQRGWNFEFIRSHSSVRPRSCIHLHIDQQSLWRPPKLFYRSKKKQHALK